MRGNSSERKGDQEAIMSKKQLQKNEEEEKGENKLSEYKEQERVKGVEKMKDRVEVVKAEINGKSAKPKEDNKHEDANKNHGDDDGDDSDEDENEFGRCIGPGSPSFRVYHIEAEKKKKKEKCEKPIIEVVHRKIPSDSSDESAESVATANSYEEVLAYKPLEMKAIEEGTKRKGQKKKKMMSIKKNLLNALLIKNRINPMLSCGTKNLPSPH